MSFGDMYYNTETSKAICFDDDGQPLVMGLDPKYKDMLPNTAQKTDMPQSEFEKLVDASLKFSFGGSEMGRILGKFGKKRPEPVSAVQDISQTS